MGVCISLLRTHTHTLRPLRRIKSVPGPRNRTERTTEKYVYCRPRGGAHRPVSTVVCRTTDKTRNQPSMINHTDRYVRYVTTRSYKPYINTRHPVHRVAKQNAVIKFSTTEKSITIRPDVYIYCICPIRTGYSEFVIADLEPKGHKSTHGSSVYITSIQ